MTNANFTKNTFFGGVIIGVAVALLWPIIEHNIRLPLPFQQYFIILLPALSVAGLIVAAQLGRISLMLFQFAKFGLVGILNTAVYFGVNNAFIHFTGIDTGRTLLVFNAISFAAAVTNSYIWNKWWTFEKTNRARVREFAQFVSVSIVGFFISELSVWFVTNILSRPESFTAAQWDNVGFVIATLLSFSWNFIGYKFWVFAQKAIE